uniref:Uncharacterized protein n=1 Tax=Setaria italica TaxID=4555 RepID=K3Y4D6_SETIT
MILSDTVQPEARRAVEEDVVTGKWKLNETTCLA